MAWGEHFLLRPLTPAWCGVIPLCALAYLGARTAPHNAKGRSNAEPPCGTNDYTSRENTTIVILYFKGPFLNFLNGHYIIRSRKKEKKA
jgi:hypothetical protein